MRMRRIITLILLIASLSFTNVQAHDWYSQGCCGGEDCHPIDSCSEMSDSDDGGVTWQGYHFSKDQVHPSQDNKCHVCIHEYQQPVGKKPMCAYVQQGV